MNVHYEIMRAIGDRSLSKNAIKAAVQRAQGVTDDHVRYQLRNLERLGFVERRLLISSECSEWMLTDAGRDQLEQTEKQVKRCADAGANPDRLLVDADAVIANIAQEFFFTAAEGVDGAGPNMETGRRDWPSLSYEENLKRITFCVLVLRNGFVVTGEAFCASTEIIDNELGRAAARLNAMKKIYPLMHYAIMDTISDK